MSKTRIEWCTHSVNPVKGLCPVDCRDLQGKPYCYARKMYRRFGWNPEIRWEGAPAWDAVAAISQPSRIFWGSTMELFGPWVKDHWLRLIFKLVQAAPQHTHIFLTKRPQELVKWSPFPRNCFIGVSVTNQRQYDEAILHLKDVVATVKFLSIEPLLSRIDIDG